MDGRARLFILYLYRFYYVMRKHAFFVVVVVLLCIALLGVQISFYFVKFHKVNNLLGTIVLIHLN